MVAVLSHKATGWLFATPFTDIVLDHSDEVAQYPSVVSPLQDRVQSLLFKAACSCLSIQPGQTELTNSHLTYFRWTKKPAWRRHTLSGRQTSLKDTSGKIYGSSCVLWLQTSTPMPQSSTTRGWLGVGVPALAASLRKGLRPRKGNQSPPWKGSQIKYVCHSNSLGVWRCQGSESRMWVIYREI